MAKDKAAKAAKKEAKKAAKANKPKDPEMKLVVIKCIAALACVAIFSATVSSGFSKIADAKLAGVNNNASENGSEDADTSSDDFFNDFDGAGSSDSNAAENDATASDNGEATDNGTEATDPTDAASSDNASAPSDSKPAAASSAPQTTEDIIKYYNAATAKAFNAKVPFTKERTTIEKKFEAGAVLSGMKDIVYKFMGVGDKNKFTKTVTADDKDSYHKYLQASKLTAADVTEATCKQSGDNYLITIKIKDGSSSVRGGNVVSSNNSPLDHAGLACGDNDKDYWDHKTAENVMSAIKDVPGCGGANIDESYKGAVINVVINSKTGNIVQLGASFSFSFNLEKLMGSKGVAEASTSLIMKDFKW